MQPPKPGDLIDVSVEVVDLVTKRDGTRYLRVRSVVGIAEAACVSVTFPVELSAVRGR